MWWAVLLSWWLLGSLAYCCPQHCRCFTDDEGYKVANCSKSGLLSGDIAPTIDILNFKNQLRGSRTKLEARIFRNFRGVQYLNLQNSSISHLPNDVFEGLSRVIKIDLSFNKIKHLNGVVFKSVPSLRYLSLRGNFLSLSPLEVIVSDTLQELDMGLCSITSIPLHLFGSAPNLRSLTLDGNFIQNIEYNVLPKGLTYLNLANNNIIKPPINVFNSLRHLIRLDISNNPINCSCSLLVFQDTLSGRAGILENDVVCTNPPHLLGKKISAVNENQLCRDDYIKREGINSLIHRRSKKNHHIDPQVQSDEPLMMDESYGAREAAEVMFTNDETNQMGTHMENRMSLSPFGETSDDNKLLETMDETTQVTETGDESPEVDDPPQELTKPDEHSIASDPTDAGETHSSGAESLTGEELDKNTGEGITTESEGLDHKITEDVEQRTKDNANSVSSEVHTSPDPENESSSEPPSPDQQSNPAEDHHSTNLLSDMDDFKMNTTADDVETLPGMTSDHELSHLELADNGTTENSDILDKKLYTLPTSPSELSDYNYDSQHADYGFVDNSTTSDTLETSLSSASSSPEPELDEGSGDSLNDVTETNETSSTIGFMEERETETESSLKTVSDDLAELPSSTSSDVLVDQMTTEVIITSSEEPSSSEGGLQTWVESSSDASSTEIPTESPVESSSTTSYTEQDEIETSSEASPSPDPAVETSSTEPTVEASSMEPTSEVSSAEPTTEVSSSEPASEASSSEPTSEASSSEPSDIYDDPTESQTTESSTEPVTELPNLPVEISSEPSSTEIPLFEDVTSPASAITEVSSSTETYSPEPSWWDSDEVEVPSPTSSTSSPSHEESSTSTHHLFHKTHKKIEQTTESSVTPDVEVLRTDVGSSNKENIREDPSREEEEKNILTTGITFIIIGLLIALILILLTIIVCKKKKTSKKIRLPADPEAATGTELQDMLLPKPPENGIKVLPKNYTNGSTPLSNGKAKGPEVDAEEVVPVLAPEPEVDEEEPETGWEDKPEPIETVTARLTMLARPQTPIFIQKTLT